MVPECPSGVRSAEKWGDEGDGDVDAERKRPFCAVSAERRKGSRKNDEQSAEVHRDAEQPMSVAATEDVVLSEHERKGYSHRVREDARHECEARR